MQKVDWARFLSSYALSPAKIWPQSAWSAIWPSLAQNRMEWLAMLPLGVAVLALAYTLDALPLPTLWDIFFEGPKTAFLSFPAIADVKEAWRSEDSHWLIAAFKRLTLCVVLYPVVMAGAATAVWGGVFFVNSPTSAPKRSRANTFGSATWGGSRHLKLRKRQQKLTSDVGVLLGTFYGCEFRTKKHVIVCAPTGAGKGVCLVIPNLLTYKGGVFCFDPKGENYHVTSSARVAQGYPVARLDPFGLSGKRTHSFNWLDGIDVRDERCVGKSNVLAEALVERSANGDGSHWDNSAIFLLQGLILHVASRDVQAKRHMGEVRALLMQPASELQKTFEEMSASTAGFGVVARVGGSMMGKSANERSGVISTAQRHTSFLDDPAILQTLIRTDFRLAQLREHGLAIYVMMPPSVIKVYSGYVRALSTLVLEALEQQAQQKLPHSVLMMLDEYGQLGRVDKIEAGITIVRNLKVQMVLFLQGLDQLSAMHRTYSTMLGCSTFVSFGVNDNATADYVSDALGDYTVEVESRNTSRGWGMAMREARQGTNVGVHGRPLLTADEVRQLDSDKCVVLEQSAPPMVLSMRPYFKDRRLSTMARRNPMDTG